MVITAWILLVAFTYFFVRVFIRYHSKRGIGIVELIWMVLNILVVAISAGYLFGK